MLFNSIEFLIFLPIVFILYWFVVNKKLNYQNILLLSSSYFFYSWWDWRFMFLLILSTLIDYGFGLLIHSSNRKKIFLWICILNNLTVLAVFKYYNFFSVEFAQLMSAIGWKVHPYILDFALPVGISFYTFHGMSYVFDIYRGIIKPEKNFINYAVFVSFFPLLVAGPIERATHLLPQIIRPRVFNYDQSVSGLKIILWGMFKKVVIADNLAGTVNDIFTNYQDLSGSTLILGVIYFAFQIYCDFSGYSDIAIGTAQLFGFELLSNFRFPYFSRDIAEFWRRWHISLSSWFRDYVYIPLGGSKVGSVKSVRNVFIIFLLSGFWHGANWTYIVWGAVHASLFIPLFISKQNRKYANDIVAANSYLPSIREVLQIIITFIVVCFAWIFFRAENLAHAFDYILRITHLPFSAPLYKTELLYIIPLLLIDWIHRKNERVYFSKINLPLFAVIIIILILFLRPINTTIEFIYFQF